jgi:hypothetical protein
VCSCRQCCGTVPVPVSLRQIVAVPAVPIPQQCLKGTFSLDVAEALLVVPSALLNAEVGVDADVARRPRQVLVLPVGDVLMGPRISVFLGQVKFNDVDQVSLLPHAPAIKPAESCLDMVGFKQCCGSGR